MSYIRTGSAKGEIRCFQCRDLTKSRDGSWESVKNQQVFVCNHCKHEAQRNVAAEAVRAEVS